MQGIIASIGLEEFPHTICLFAAARIDNRALREVVLECYLKITLYYFGMEAKGKSSYPPCPNSIVFPVLKTNLTRSVLLILTQEADLLLVVSLKNDQL